jgi:RNA polymerase sigma-70 factor (ECF subfamily)
MEQAEIIARALRGDQDAFRELYKIAHPRVRSAVNRVLGQPDEDAIQEAFIQVFGHLRRFRVEARFTTWAYRVALNVARSIRRKLLIQFRRRDWTPGWEETAEARGLQKPGEFSGRDLSKILAALAPPGRAAFILCAVQQRSYGEAARILGWSEEILKSRLCRARKAAKRSLEKAS